MGSTSVKHTMDSTRRSLCANYVNRCSLSRSRIDVACNDRRTKSNIHLLDFALRQKLQARLPRMCRTMRVKPNGNRIPLITTVRPQLGPESRHFVQLPACCERYVFLISAGLAPAGSQLVGYNESRPLARSPLGLPQWKQRFGGYSADIHLRILS